MRLKFKAPSNNDSSNVIKSYFKIILILCSYYFNVLLKKKKTIILEHRRCYLSEVLFQTHYKTPGAVVVAKSYDIRLHNTTVMTTTTTEQVPFTRRSQK